MIQVTETTHARLILLAKKVKVYARTGHKVPMGE